MVGHRVLAQDRSGPVERAAQQQAALRHQLLVLDRSNQHELAPEKAADDQRGDEADSPLQQKAAQAAAPVPLAGEGPGVRAACGLSTILAAAYPTSITRRSVVPSPRVSTTSTPGNGVPFESGTTQPSLTRHTRTCIEVTPPSSRTVAGAAPSAAWTLRAGGEHRRDRAPSITEYVTSCTALAPLASGSENRSTCSAGAPSTICTLTGRADVDPSTGPAACARSRSI